MSVPVQANRLAVVLSGQYIADVERTRNGVLRLTYQREAARAGATPLSLSLPPVQGTFSGRPVENYVWGLLPENDVVLETLRRTHGADPRDPLSLLAVIGRDCAGAVQFCRPDEVDQMLTETERLEPASDADVEARLATMRMAQGASWTMPGEHWSLGGTQDKLTLRQEESTWFWATGAAPTTHIVKPGVRGARAQALIEHITMRAAGLLGLSVAPTQFVDFHSERAIVIERFDRARSASGRLIRLHAEDLCQSTGISEKYEEHGGPGAQALVSVLHESAATPRQARNNVAAFVDAVVFNTVIAAPDAHARNFSVLLDGDDVRLAPLYDLATALAYDPHQGTQRPLSMEIGGRWDAAEVGAHEWVRFADDIEVDAQAVRTQAAHIADGALEAFGQALDEVEDDWDGQVSEVRARLLPALAAHLNRT